MTFTYKLDPSYTVLTNKTDIDNFFGDGHPSFLIYEFCDFPADIWLSYLEYFEKVHKCAIWDQDGGEITKYDIDTDGLIKCTYEAYGIIKDEDGDPIDHKVDIEGYLVKDINNELQNILYSTKITVYE